MVDGDQQGSVARAVDGGAQGGKLRPIGKIAREQDHPADLRVPQAGALFAGEFEPGHVDHDGPRGHGGAAARMRTLMRRHAMHALESATAGKGSITTKAATMSASSVIDTCARPKRVAYQSARGPDRRISGAPPGRLRTCTRDQVMGMWMPSPIALEKASLAAKRVAR